MIEGDSATCCDCQLQHYKNIVGRLCPLCHSDIDSASVVVCVLAIANSIRVNFISIQSGFRLSQVLRHLVEGRKKLMSKYIHIEPDCSQASWLQFDK